ncbi:histidinol-phosphate transaminase [Thermovenabulum sp.]|uniref:histidinol-phosphate transaminase n=1 Tax=Thermovenabulum sp. TaxID=3100335 RepID=UPI003C7B3028
MTTRYLRKEIYEIEPFFEERPDFMIKLNANESYFDVPDDLKDEIFKEVKNKPFNLYNDPNSDELRKLLSEYCGLEKEQIFIGNGADEIIADINFAFAGPESKVYIFSPTFPSYEVFAKISGAEVINIPLVKIKDKEFYRFDIDLNEYYDRLKKDSMGTKNKVMFICSPNNPTGDYFNEEAVKEIIESFDGIICIDEAYFEFGGKTYRDMIFEHENLIIIRTMSKIFSIAGLRIGYALGNKEIIRELFRVKLPFNVNLFSQTAASLILKNRERFLNNIGEIIKERDRMIEELMNIKNIRIFTTSTNFILLESNIEAKKVFEELVKRGILVRIYNSEALKFSLRVSVGKREENNKFIEALKEILEEANA